MKTFDFLKSKYGFELLMDLGRFEENAKFFFEPETHAATFYEVMFFDEGNGYLLLDDQHIPLSPRSIVFISPLQKRQWFVERATLKGYYLIFQENFLSSFFSDKLFVFRLQYFYNTTHPLYLLADDALFAKSEQVFAEILSEIQHYESDSEHVIRSLLYFVLIKLNRAFARTYDLSAETRQNNYAYRFKHLLERHIREHHTVTAYAALLSTSRITLNHSVKRQFGRTASAMLRQRLVYEIKNELRYTTQTISEIAFGLGFSEPHNLTRFFKAHVGLTPHVFRVAYQNDR